MAARREALAAGLLVATGRVPGAGIATGGSVAADGGSATALPSAGRTLGFGGDVMLGRGVDRAHRDGDPTAVWGSTLERLRELDGVVANLECVLSDRGEPWPDKRFHFRASPEWAVAALQAVPTAAVALANNHAMDFGPPALLDTVAALDRVGIAHTGAGVDLDAALEPAVADVGDLTVAVVGLVDHWDAFAAGRDDPGTAYAELSVDDERSRELARTAIGRARAAEPDLLVASLHWGYNYQTRPEESHRRFGRWLLDHGVDVVHGHSAHVVQGIEVHDGRPILYDCGEFVDDYANREGYHNDRSYLVELVLGDAPHLRLVPIEIEGYRVHRAGDAAADWLARTIRERSAAFDTSFEPGAEPGVLCVPLGQ